MLDYRLGTIRDSIGNEVGLNAFLRASPAGVPAPGGTRTQPGDPDHQPLNSALSARGGHLHHGGPGAE